MTATDKERLAFIEEIIEILRGSYTDEGIRMWFNRPRSYLEGQSPAEHLYGTAWHPESAAAKAVRHLAELTLAVL